MSALVPASPHEMLEASMTCNASVTPSRDCSGMISIVLNAGEICNYKRRLFLLLNVTKSVFSNKVQKCINNLITYKEVKLMFYKYLMNELGFYTVVMLLRYALSIIVLHIVKISRCCLHQRDKYCLSEAPFQIGQCCGAVRSFTHGAPFSSLLINWMHLTAIGEVIGSYVPTTILHSISGDKQWFDPCCRRAYDTKLIGLLNLV